MKTYRKDDPVSYSLGAYPTFELLHQRPELVEIVYISEKIHQDLYKKLTSLCDKNNIPYEFNHKGISKISKKDNVYIAARFQKYDENLDENSHILLYQPSNMGNVGTILRSALGFDYRNIGMITPGVDPFDPRVIRASMGAIFSQKIELFSSFEEYKKKYNRTIYAFYLEKALPLSTIEPQYPHTLFFGNEGSGIPYMYHKETTPVRIESNEDIDSLNLPMAATIAMYSFYTQRK